MKKRSIFIKILIAFLIVAITPVIVSNFLIAVSYQAFINEYIKEISQKPIQTELETIKENLLIESGLTVFLIVILVIFAAFFLARTVSRPLRELVRKTQEISKGNLDVKIKIKTKDEFGELAQAFNKMVQELKEARTILEIKVKARTKELEELAEKQEELVKQRTKELEEKVRELEKFQKLAIGRELKMIELKKEIKKLKGRTI